jgi:hypothetical protein
MGDYEWRAFYSSVWRPVCEFRVRRIVWAYSLAAARAVFVAALSGGVRLKDVIVREVNALDEWSWSRGTDERPPELGLHETIEWVRHVGKRRGARGKAVTNDSDDV